MEKAESYASGLEANLEAQKLRTGLLGQALGSAGDIIGGGVSGGGLFSSLIDAGTDGLDWLKKALGI
jgi:phage-related minor tail protein